MQKDGEVMEGPGNLSQSSHHLHADPVQISSIMFRAAAGLAVGHWWLVIGSLLLLHCFDPDYQTYQTLSTAIKMFNSYQLLVITCDAGVQRRPVMIHLMISQAIPTWSHPILMFICIKKEAEQ